MDLTSKREALRAALGVKRNAAANAASGGDNGISDLNALLMQVAFALMMVFMIAYFLFQGKAKSEIQEQVLELQRQKLIAALDSVGSSYAERYGLNTLLIEDAPAVVETAPDAPLSTPTTNEPDNPFAAFDAEDAAALAARPAEMRDEADAPPPMAPQRRFHPDMLVENGRLTAVPALREAFCTGAVRASADYDDPETLHLAWRARVLSESGLAENELNEETRRWLSDEIENRTERHRVTVSDLQLDTATELQRHWAAHPNELGLPDIEKRLADLRVAASDRRLLLATELAQALRNHCFAYLSREASAPLLAK